MRPAVKSYYEDIAKALLPERRVGLMHGKLKPKEKAAVMEDFKAGRLDLSLIHILASSVSSGRKKSFASGSLSQ